MISPAICNSLLRVNRATGIPPSPFERPNGNLDFWVLELPGAEENELAGWCVRITGILRKHASLLARLSAKGSRLTLFIDTSGEAEVLRLEAGFLKMLGDLGVALEHFHSAE